MITRQEAQKLIQENISILETEKKPILKCLGFVLAEEVKSNLDLPPFDKSAMDGFAISEKEFSDELEIIDTVQAGQLPSKKVSLGKAIKIMTGAKVPQNTARVVMKEDTQFLSENKIRINLKRDNRNICFKGEDIKKGQIIYKKGDYISSVVIANIISAGINIVNVYKKPRIGIIITGTELLEAGEPYQQGKIYNSNGPLLENLLRERGNYHTNLYSTKDDEAELTDCINDALKENDLLILTGGISVGDYDFTKFALENLGAKTIFHKLAIKPGKPIGFFQKNNTSVFALPGNPVSVFLGFHLFIVPILNQIQGLGHNIYLNKINISKEFSRKNDDREQFVPIILKNDKILFPDFHGSAHLLAINDCNAFLVVPKGKKKIEYNEEVEIFLF